VFFHEDYKSVIEDSKTRTCVKGPIEIHGKRGDFDNLFELHLSSKINDFTL